MADNNQKLRALLHGGLVIPAHPLALDANRRLDERRQRALTRYYCEAGAGGLAIGVHTTQFSIRQKTSACMSRCSVLPWKRCTRSSSARRKLW